MIDYTEQIIEWTKEKMGDSFEFRKGQLETIVDIVDTFFNKKTNLYLLDCPTGSGKSIIAMIVSGFLADLGNTGYILSSDISLQTQYEQDIAKYGLGWGSIKGMDNYLCHENGEKFSLGECRLKNMSYEEAEGLSCSSDCGYLGNRRQAIYSSVSLLNYSYWLIQMNYAGPKMKQRGKIPPFTKRDFTICDEAHKVTEIVQNHFSPKIGVDTYERLESFYEFIKRKNIKLPSLPLSFMEKTMDKIKIEEDKKQLSLLLLDIELFLAKCLSTVENLKETVSKTFVRDERVPKEWRFGLALCDWIKDMHCKFEDYNAIISKVGVDCIIKNPNGLGFLTFNCLEESYMMNKHFHDQAEFKVLMTATMGDPNDYLKNIGANDAIHCRVPSTFDFKKSPIMFYSKRKMSFKYKDKNFGWMVDTIENIVSKHEGENGIIHAGSYDNAIKVYHAVSQEIRDKLILYTNSKEKNIAIEKFLDSSGKMLIGPTLLEGLNLFDDKSRFQIFLKVPYPNLTDKFVQAKLQYQKSWYNWQTIVRILQGTGRSVRSETDYATTYILDGCLSDLFRTNRTSFPPEFQERIILVE